MEDFPAPTQLMIIKYLFWCNARVHYLSTEKQVTQIWEILARLAVPLTPALKNKLQKCEDLGLNGFYLKWMML